MKKIFTLLLIFSSYQNLYAQDATWNGGVGKIIYNNCTNCHHEGGIGPFPILTYDDAKDRALSIKAHTQDRHMPPWKADPNYTHFIGERRLSDAEVNLIAEWVDNGTPLGTGVSPVPPTIKLGSQLNRIDQSTTFPKYTVQLSTDDYRTFVMPTTHNSTKHVNAIEFLPSNASIVHHIILYHDPTSYSRNLDSLDPGPGYASNGTGAASPSAKLLGLWTPGAGIFYLPDNMGYELPVGTDLVLEVHYAPNSNAKTDSTQVNIKYTSNTPVRVITMDLPLFHFPPVLQQPALIIPANTVKEFSQRAVTPNTDISIVGIFPHMHLIGRSYTIFTTKASDTTKLIRIPDWDFHWQGFYTFQKLIKIPRQSILQGKAVYDNTLNNPHNPSNPPITVSSGENTKDEMMVAFIAYTPYQAGDENIILDSTLLSTGIKQTENLDIKIYPNPVNDFLTIELEEEINSVKIISLDGRILLNKFSENKIDVSTLSAGIYFVEIKTERSSYRKKIVKSN
jgi:Secretion system C-terminal sorting domain/Copper type II ascorbate-dependent monooxygenase, N-terminal domain/Copper type II ascorbate-dependent monooxygenase, C-terminal domain